MKTHLLLSRFILIFQILTLFGCGCEPDPVDIGPPILEVITPFDLGQSPKGISVRAYYEFKNVGEARLKINDFRIKPDDGIFQVGITELPLEIAGSESIEIAVTFRPTAEQKYNAELILDFGPETNGPPSIDLKGTGITNLVCLPCIPPPEPECQLEGEVSIFYESTTITDCESEEGICSYLIFELLCDEGVCEEETGNCPAQTEMDAGLNFSDAGTTTVDAGHDDPAPTTDAGHDDPTPTADAGHDDPTPTTDAGHDDPTPTTDAGHDDPTPTTDAGHDDPTPTTDAGAPANDCNGTPNGSAYLDECGQCVGGNTGLGACQPDAGEPLSDAGTTTVDAGETEIDAGPIFIDTDNDGISDEDDAYPEHHNGDLQFIIDLIENSGLNLAPLDLGGMQIWTNGRLTEVDFRLCNLSGPIPPSIQNATKLVSVNLAINNLTGSIPSEIGALALLKKLELSYNQLSGDLPPELFALYELVELSLGYNAQLGGILSSEIGNLISLEDLWLGHTLFSGPLPDTLGNLTSLKHLDLSFNLFSDQVSSILPLFAQLEYLDLDRNGFSGQLPNTLCELSDLTANFSNNYFCGPYPACILNGPAVLGDQNTSDCACGDGDDICLSEQDCGIISYGCHRLAKCPLTDGFGICQCRNGYKGDGQTLCDLAQCPDNSAGAPECLCAGDDDYFGDLEWDDESNRWVGTCEYDPCLTASCPAGQICVPIPKDADAGTDRYTCE